MTALGLIVAAVGVGLMYAAFTGQQPLVELRAALTGGTGATGAAIATPRVTTRVLA